MCSDAADKVVQGTGKFEELVVASHDIAASTAQLVAASRVKARPKSEKLKSLKVSSRNGQLHVQKLIMYVYCMLMIYIYILFFFFLFSV